MTEQAADATTIAQAVFYNMTGQDVQMEVNGQMTTIETVSAIPSTTPYTPNHNANTYTRVNTDEPQVNQFGNKNRLEYSSSGGLGFSVDVNIDVNAVAYPVTDPLLIFMFTTAVVITCPSDSVPYLGKTGGSVNVDPSDTSAIL